MTDLTEQIGSLSTYTNGVYKHNTISELNEMSRLLNNIYRNFKIGSRVSNVVSPQLNPQTSISNSRDNNRKRENERVDYLCDSINTGTDLGNKLKDSYLEKFNKTIDRVVKTNSNQQHYDIVVYHSDGTSSRCEEKGTCTKQTIESLKSGHPWQNSVQRFNGPGDKFRIGLKYAKTWYETVLVGYGEDIRKTYNIETPIPPLEEWLKQDAFVCSDAQSSFGRELKEKYRAKHPGGSMNGKGSSPRDYRCDVNSIFIERFTADDKSQLITETQTVLNDIMAEKDCWLKTSGTIDDGFTFCWFNSIDPPQIIDVSLSWKSGADIYIEFKTENKSDEFKSILRFGKGTGFSNIRFDIR